MTTRIFLIRHGETPWSLSGQHTGRTDLPLTANGETRASELRGVLQRIAFTHVFASPLQRARRTCELAGLGATAQLDSDLQEWDYGDYDGLTSAEIRRQHAGWNVFQDGSPRGESVAQISERANRVVARLRSLDGTIALFSHGHFLRVLAARWLGLPARDGRLLVLDTASVSTLSYEHHNQDEPVISLWNVRATPLS